MQIRDQLRRLGDALLGAHGAHLPICPDEAEWPSSCVVGPAPGGRYWRPVAMTPPLDFSGLERALECHVRADVTAYFGSFWSAGLPVAFNDNALELLQMWNADDIDNLVANQIGHALQKRRLNQSLSLFFAVVDERRFLSVDNDSGAVLLETVGERQPLEVSDSLLAFLEQTNIDMRSAAS